MLVGLETCTNCPQGNWWYGVSMGRLPVQRPLDTRTCLLKLPTIPYDFWQKVHFRRIRGGTPTGNGAFISESNPAESILAWYCTKLSMPSNMFGCAALTCRWTASIPRPTGRSQAEQYRPVGNTWKRVIAIDCFLFGGLRYDILAGLKRRRFFEICSVGGALDGGGGNEGFVSFKYGLWRGGLLDGCGGRDIVCCNLANKNNTGRSSATSR